MKIDTKEGIDRYVEMGVPPGGFLRCVLENKLMESFGAADAENQRDMLEIVSYVYNEVPRSAWGSEEVVDGWLAMKRRERLSA